LQIDERPAVAASRSRRMDSPSVIARSGNIVIARSASDEAIHVSAWGEMDCFARNDAGKSFALPAAAGTL